MLLNAGTGGENVGERNAKGFPGEPADVAPNDGIAGSPDWEPGSAGEGSHMGFRSVQYD
jgi:hypothetical protein